MSILVVVNCPSRWYLYRSLALCLDHQSQLIPTERLVQQCTRGVQTPYWTVDKTMFNRSKCACILRLTTVLKRQMLKVLKQHLCLGTAWYPACLPLICLNSSSHLWSPLWLNNKLPRPELTDKLRQNDVLKFCNYKVMQQMGCFDFCTCTQKLSLTWQSRLYNGGTLFLRALLQTSNSKH